MRQPSSHRSLRVFVCALLALALTSSLGAASEPSDPLARELKARGDAAMDHGNFAAATEAYGRALGVEDAPVLHYNRARALQGLGRNAEALDDLETFTRTADPSLASRVPDLAVLQQRLRAQVAVVTLTTNVPGAVAVLDDGRLLHLPAHRRYVDVGARTVRVSAPGFDAGERALALAAGTETTLDVALARTDSAGRLRVTSGVVGAEVWVDGLRVGGVPLEVELPPGEHVISVRHPDHQPKDVRVSLGAKERRSLDVSLEKLPTVFQKWWFWGGVAAVTAGGIAIAVIATRTPNPPRGDIAPGIVSAPLRF